MHWFWAVRNTKIGCQTWYPKCAQIRNLTSLVSHSWYICLVFTIDLIWSEFSDQQKSLESTGKVQMTIINLDINRHKPKIPSGSSVKVSAAMQVVYKFNHVMSNTSQTDAVLFKNMKKYIEFGTVHIMLKPMLDKQSPKLVLRNLLWMTPAGARLTSLDRQTWLASLENDALLLWLKPIYNMYYVCTKQVSFQSIQGLLRKSDWASSRWWALGSDRSPG